MVQFNARISVVALMLVACWVSALLARNESPSVGANQPVPVESTTAVNPAKDAPPDTMPSSELETHSPPYDPCLPSVYRDWREPAREDSETPPKEEYSEFRILIHRGLFRLTLEGLRPDGQYTELYSSDVGVGAPRTPTPLGAFIINHVYCYPDVALFHPEHGPIRRIYRDFFAPILACDEAGRCERFRDMGIHGFDATAFPLPGAITPGAEGFVSGGCVRLPDPCAFKKALTRAVRLGPLKKNERGSYHWLAHPIEVIIYDDKVTILSLLEEGIGLVTQGVGNALGLVGP